MKKITPPLVALLALTLLSQIVFSSSFTRNEFVVAQKMNAEKEKRMSIVSSRISGEVQVRFMAEKPGDATITVLNEAGKIVLQQQNHVRDGSNTISIKHLLTLNEGQYTVNLVSLKITYSSSLLLWK